MKNYRLTAALCAALMLTAVPFTPMMETASISVHAADLAEGDCSYTVDADGNATLTKYTGEGGDVNIPSTIGGKPVTRIGDSSFDHCTSLTAVTLPACVT